MEDVFFLPHNKESILYIPLKGKVFKINRFVKGLLQDYLKGIEDQTEIEKEIIEYFLEQKVFEKSKFNLEKFMSYLPTKAIIMPSLACNLRCLYCYSNSGGIDKMMPLELAISVVDLISENIEKTGKPGEINFMGGGETFMNWQLMKKCVDYIKLKKNKIRITATTNGMITESQIKWVGTNLDAICISFDGPYGQDIHRPTTEGENSFDTVFSTLKLIDEIDIPYTIRSTISEYNVHKMGEFVDFLGQNLKNLKMLQLEPVFYVGRSVETDLKPPNIDDFFIGYKTAFKKSKNYGFKVTYSGSKLKKLSQKFCGAVSGNFVVTPNGIITSCPEVLSYEDEESKTFIIGKFDFNDRKFQFDMEKIKTLGLRSVKNIEFCKNCFAKYNCCGDCPVKTSRTYGSIMEQGINYRCELNKKVLKYELIELLEEPFKLD